jgi:CcmD family protein
MPMIAVFIAVSRRLSRAAAGLAALSSLMLAAGATAFAQTPEGFTAAGPEDLMRESLPATPFVFIAYGVAWLAVFVYVFAIWRRLSRVEADLARVQSRLDTPPRR